MAELRLDRSLDFVKVSAKDNGIELFNHLAGAERTEITAAPAGRAGRVLACDVFEVRAVEYFRLKLFTELRVIIQNMPCSGFSHEGTHESGL